VTEAGPARRTNRNHFGSRRNLRAAQVAVKPNLNFIRRSFSGAETLLLYSDGLHRSVPHEQLTANTASADDPREGVQRLADAAVACGTRNTVTELVVRCAG
jgi:serine/threonine protein phosphatase PrpC